MARGTLFWDGLELVSKPAISIQNSWGGYRRTTHLVPHFFALPRSRWALASYGLYVVSQWLRIALALPRPSFSSHYDLIVLLSRCRLAVFPAFLPPRLDIVIGICYGPLRRLHPPGVEHPRHPEGERKRKHHVKSCARMCPYRTQIQTGGIVRSRADIHQH